MELALSVMTIPNATFADRVVAAAAAGFDGIGLRPGDRRRALAAGATDDDLRGVLAEHGLAVVEIDVITGWGGSAADVEGARAHEDRVYELVDALGGRHVTVVGDTEGPADRVAELFAAMCDRAAEHGLGVGLEYLPWTTVPTLGAALDVVEAAGRPNGGVVVDAWHHERGDADWALLADVDPARVAGIQLCDGRPATDEPLLTQTFHRAVPGEGVFDLVRFLSSLAPVLDTAPLCVEVISPALAALDPGDAAAACADATRRLLAEAGA